MLGWAVDERWTDLLSARGAEDGPRGPGKPLVDVLHVLRVGAWRKSPLSAATSRELRAATRELREVGYDLALDFQGAIRSAMIARVARIPRRLGFASPREAPAGMFYTRVVEARGVHIVEQNVSLALSAAPGSAPDILFDLPRDPANEPWADGFLRGARVSDFVMMNPGAGWGAKQWPPERYGEVAKELARHGMQSVVNYGPGEDAVAAAVVNASGGAATSIACSVGQLITLARRARLFTGGDTGPLHVAAALGVPVVAIYGPTDPARNGPYGTRALVLRSEQSRTSHARRRRTEAGMMNITVAEVVEAVLGLLEGK
jgi:heptosyltransferase-1